MGLAAVTRSSSAALAFQRRTHGDVMSTRALGFTQRNASFAAITLDDIGGATRVLVEESRAITRERHADARTATFSMSGSFADIATLITRLRARGRAENLRVSKSSRRDAPSLQ